jgi:hypothetical protein
MSDRILVSQPSPDRRIESREPRDQQRKLSVGIFWEGVRPYEMNIEALSAQALRAFSLLLIDCIQVLERDS